MSEPEFQGSDNTVAEVSNSGWRGHHVYLMALACLVIGIAVGYFLRGSQSPMAAVVVPSATQQANPGHEGMQGQRPSLEKLKMMADKAAAPALERLKKSPNDFETLNELGKLYRGTHQFKEAATYYEKALAVDPKNAAVRTDLASCLYYTGDVDDALAQLDKALGYDPQFFGALLNSGIIKLRAKNDVPGAVASWEKILKTNADPKQKQMIKKMIADAKRQAEKTT